MSTIVSVVSGPRANPNASRKRRLDPDAVVQRPCPHLSNYRLNATARLACCCFGPNAPAMILDRFAQLCFCWRSCRAASLEFSIKLTTAGPDLIRYLSEIIELGFAGDAWHRVRRQLSSSDVIGLSCPRPSLSPRIRRWHRRWPYHQIAAGRQQRRRGAHTRTKSSPPNARHHDSGEKGREYGTNSHCRANLELGQSLKSWRRECICNKNSLLVVQSDPAYTNAALVPTCDPASQWSRFYRSLSAALAQGTDKL
jgi:hypothetical protein